jgi:hypothetical protein
MYTKIAPVQQLHIDHRGVFCELTEQLEIQSRDLGCDIPDQVEYPAGLVGHP